MTKSYTALESFLNEYMAVKKISRLRGNAIRTPVEVRKNGEVIFNRKAKVFFVYEPGITPKCYVSFAWDENGFQGYREIGLHNSYDTSTCQMVSKAGILVIPYSPFVITLTI